MEEDNPKQVKVLSQACDWVVLPFKAAQTTCFDTASNKLTDMACNEKERRKLPIDIESGAMKVPSCFRENKERILKETAEEMRQHLVELGPKTIKSKIKVVPRDQKTAAKQAKAKPIKKQMPKDADIKSVVADFIQSVPQYKTIADWADYASKTMKSIIKKSKAPDTDETEGTIERYLWEISQIEPEVPPNAKKIAAKLAGIYAKNLDQA